MRFSHPLNPTREGQPWSKASHSGGLPIMRSSGLRPETATPPAGQPIAQAVFALLDQLVHSSARRDRRERDAHARFIGTRIICGLVGLAALPFALSFGDLWSLSEATLVATIAVVLLPAALVSTTGRLVIGQNLSSVLLAAVIVLLTMPSRPYMMPLE